MWRVHEDALPPEPMRVPSDTRASVLPQCKPSALTILRPRFMGALGVQHAPPVKCRGFLP